MTEYRNGNVPGGAHEYETWDAAYVLGSLSDSDCREYERHLAGCAPCRDAVAELAGLAPLLSLVDDDVPRCPRAPTCCRRCWRRPTSDWPPGGQRAACDGTGRRAANRLPDFPHRQLRARSRRVDRIRLAGRGQHPCRTQRLVSAQRAQSACGRRPLVRRRRHGARRPVGERSRRLVPQPLGTHRELRESSAHASTTTTAAETCTPASPTPMSSGMPERPWR